MANWKRKKPEQPRIPAPNRSPEYDFVFYPIIRASKVIPWGYEVSEEDEDVLLPVEMELLLLERAKEYLKRYTYRDVAAWLSESSGRYITSSGLWARIKLEQKHAKEYAVSKRLAEAFKKKYIKARKLEEGCLGLNSSLTDMDIEEELFGLVKDAEEAKTTSQGKARKYRRTKGI